LRHKKLKIKISAPALPIRIIPNHSFPFVPFSISIASISFAGIINSTGKLWKDQRRFLHDKLRQFGMTYMGNGKQQMQKRIMVSSANSDQLAGSS